MATAHMKFGPEHFPAGTIIFRQGDPPAKFYIITNGVVEVMRLADDGVERVINQLGAGDFFGEIGMLQWQRRLATLRAVTDVDVMVMDRDTFRNWLNSSSLIEAEITETVAQRMAQDAAVPDEAMPAAVDSEPDEEIEDPETAVAAMLPSSITAARNDSGPVSFPAGTVIMREGEKAEIFYIIVSGRVEVFKDDADGIPQFVAHLESGDYFGEIGLLEESTRTATVKALTDVRALAFNGEAFAQWLSKNPESEADIVNTAHQRLTDTGTLRPLP